MENFQVIKNSQFGSLTIIMVDGKAMFKAKECALLLGYKDTVNAIKLHCKGVVKHHLPTNGGYQRTNLISEGDLWRLIIHSKLPQAEQIENWIMDEVLPSIRKTGKYETPQYEQISFEESSNNFHKTYRGQEVITLSDFCQFTNKKRWGAYSNLIRICTRDTDFSLLSGGELVAFKTENNLFTISCSHLYVIYKSGFEKLCKYFNVKMESELFNAIEKKSDLPIYQSANGTLCALKPQKKESEDVSNYIVTLSALNHILRKEESNAFQKDEETIAQIKKAMACIASSIVSLDKVVG